MKFISLVSVHQSLLAHYKMSLTINIILFLEIIFICSQLTFNKQAYSRFYLQAYWEYHWISELMKKHERQL